MRAFLSTLLVLIHSLSICVPQSAFGKSKINCQPDGESIIVTSAQEKPDWINKPHSADARYENFTGLSTQNEKLENGKKLALKEAKTSLLDAIGELIQTQNKILETMNDTDMQSKLGSLNAPTLLKIKPDEMYYEKVVSYSNCKPRYYYNVWVLLKMQKQDFTKAQDEAIAYLQKAQREEKAKKPQPLLPNPKIEFSNKTPIKESTTLIEKKIDLNSLPKDLYKTDRYNNRIHDNNPHNADTKNWSKTKTLWVVAGILAVGAVTGAVFATQGGSGGSSATGNLSPTPSTGGIISISAPVPK